MHVIEIENWPRKDHFHLYSGFEFPHVNICVQVDISDLWALRKRIEASPTITLVYVVTKAANRLPEMRQRIRDQRIIEHDMIHPLITIMGDNDLFGVVTLVYDANFMTFATNASDYLAEAKGNPSLDAFPHDQTGDFPRDDLLSITLLPWLSFTAFSITRRPRMDCIPLLGLGKVQEIGGRNMLPFFINFHHALADGLQIARFVKYIEEEAQELSVRFE